MLRFWSCVREICLQISHTYTNIDLSFPGLHEFFRYFQATFFTLHFGHEILIDFEKGKREEEL